MDDLFQEKLGRFVNRARYSMGQLADLTGIPKRTIANWLGGRVRRPRRWQSLLRVADALHLSAAETDELLEAAGHETLASLRRTASKAADRALLAPWSTPGDVPFQAVADLPYFVGRSALSAEIEEALRHGRRVAMTSLRGMGGVGKTSLAAHLAYQLRSHFVDGVLWAHLDTSDTMSILAAFAAAYGRDVTHHRDVAGRAAAVRGELAGKRLLMVLDNAESSAQVRPLLPPSTDDIVVIVTTRRDLAVSDQMTRFLIEPFPARGEEALAVFTHFLGAQTVRRWRNELQAIAGMLGGLPLAITIAAGRLAAGTAVPAYLAQLEAADSKLDALVREDRSVRLSFDVTFAALPHHLQAFFVALGAFGGDDFTVEAAAHVTDAPEETAVARLDRLVSLSLVQPAVEKRFALHPLLRSYTREKEGAPAARERMVAYYLHSIAHHQDDPQPIRRELSNIVFALDTAQAHGMTTSFTEGVLALSTTWRMLGNQVEAIPYLETALATAEAVGKTRQVCQLLLELGSSKWEVGEFREARSLFKRGVRLASIMEDNVLIGRFLTNQGVIAAYNEGDYETAKRYLVQGLAHARAADDIVRQGMALSNLANAYFEQGEWEEADRYWKEGLDLLAAQGEKNSAPYVRLLCNRGVLALDRGAFSRAVTFLEEALKRAQALGFAELQSTAQAVLGRAAYEQGALDRAHSLLMHALALAREAQLPEAVTTTLCHLASLATRRGNAEEASAYLDEAEASARTAGIAWLMVDVVIRRGELLLTQGEPEAAAEQFATAVAEARANKVLELEALALFGQARATAEMGEPEGKETAVRQARAALTLLARLDHFKAAEVREWLQKEELQGEQA